MSWGYKMFLGAINKVNGKYVPPSEGIKEENYKCSDCGSDVILCKGEKIRPYFRHKNDTNCSYYTNPGESQIHKDSKMLLKHILENNNITICRVSKKCECINKKDILTKNCEVVLEYRFEYKGSFKIADVACIKNGELFCIFEVFHTHKTKEENRPEPWYELTSMNIRNVAEKQKEGGIIFECVRENIYFPCECETCEKCKCRFPKWVGDTNVISNKICKNCDVECFSRRYLNVPFLEKENAKKLGCRWDSHLKKWFVEQNIFDNNPKNFSKWV